MKKAATHKHAADKETNDKFKQQTLYLEAVINYLMGGATLERHSSTEEHAWKIFEDTLNLMK